MSNINEINGRRRKGQFGHCPICLEQAAFSSVYLRWNIQMKSEQWSASSGCFRTSGCLLSFTLTHWLHFEVPEVLFFWISVTQKKGQDSGQLSSALRYNLSQPALESSGMKMPRPARKHHQLIENLPNTAPNMRFIKNSIHSSQFFLLIYFSYTFQMCNISFLRKNMLQPKELTFMRFQTLCCVPDKWGTKAFPYSVWGSIGWGILGHPTCLASRIMMNCLQLWPQIVF